jgi:hypothetical protein
MLMSLMDQLSLTVRLKRSQWIWTTADIPHANIFLLTSLPRTSFDILVTIDLSVFGRELKFLAGFALLAPSSKRMT